ncbi:MAG: hypothetical protein JWO85_1209 [Candidatus Eremiobacteraeota bacterium]|nr:hypothetical protein [Candidatus Eremiobacteraeota bacterium]
MRLETFDPANPLDGAEPVYAGTGLPVTDAPKTNTLRAVAPRGDSLGRILDDALTALKRYVDLSPELSHSVLLWATWTHVAHLSNLAPILFVNSVEPGAGKSTLLSVLGVLCRNPKLMFGMTKASLVRTLSKNNDKHGLGCSTTMIDELDTLVGPQANAEKRAEFAGILNCAYTRDGIFSLMGKDKTGGFVPEDHRLFGPLVLSGIVGTKGLLNGPTHTRCVSIPIEPTTKTLEDFEVSAMPVLLEIAERMKAWAADYCGKNPSLPIPENMPEGITPRHRDVFRPLVAIADEAGPKWAALGRAAVVASASTVTEVSAGVRMLRHLHAIFTERDIDRLPLNVIVEALNADSEQYPREGGRRYVVADLSDALRSYGVTSKVEAWKASKERCYTWDKLRAPWSKYTPELSLRRPRTYSEAKSAGAIARPERIQA